MQAATKLARDLCEAHTSRPHLSNPLAICYQLRPPQGLAQCPRAPQSGPRPLNQPFPLQLGERGEQGQDDIGKRPDRVEAGFLIAAEAYAIRLEPIQVLTPSFLIPM